jgi:hypothetical protein
MDNSNFFARIAILCRKLGLNETDESVAEWCYNQDEAIYMTDPQDVAYMIAEYCEITV